MGWAASLAFILAATYFVKLVYDAGWLTPERQIGLAALSGLGLIALGLAIARVDRAYAAYLPAVGIVVLYLSIYAGHTFYHFFGLYPAMAGVAAITFAAIWLGRRFDNSVYALLAVVGTYLTPLLVESARSNVIDLVVYFSAWGLLFSFVALQEMRRRVYLLALFFALFGFDIAFRMTDESAWQTAVVYQFIQFLIFSATAACFSIRHQKPMENAEALLHGLALFYFYIIQFILLKQHVPEWAPGIALASVVIVLGLFFAARRAIEDPTGIRGGAVLVSSYCSVVTAHVLFFELMPDGWHAWAALLLPIGFGLAQYRIAHLGGAFLPALAVGMLIFSLGFLEALVARPSRSDIPFPGPLLFLYAASLYAAYLLLRRRQGSYLAAPLPLYAGHLALLTASVRVFDSALTISVAWAISAVLLLGYAVKREDRVVGQSSLILFAASGLKVLLYDLAGSAPMVRVLTLVVLAVSLYAGGWLYQQMSQGNEDFHPDPALNAQLRLIKRLGDRGLDDAGILDELNRQGVRRLGGKPGGETAGETSWSIDSISQIRRDYGFAQ
jgi:uncharacterized membrane protein